MWPGRPSLPYYPGQYNHRFQRSEVCSYYPVYRDSVMCLFLLQKKFYNMLSKLLAFLYKAGRHLPAGRYVRPTIGQLYQSAESAAASITILTAVVFQFSSSDFGFQVSSLVSGSSTRITAKHALQGWFVLSQIRTMILPSARRSPSTFFAIQEISWRTGAVQLFCCLLERKATPGPSGSSCGGLSLLSPFSPSSPSSFSLS